MKPTRSIVRTAAFQLGQAVWWMIRGGIAALVWIVTFAVHFALDSNASGNRPDDDSDADPTPFNPHGDFDDPLAYAEYERLQEENDRR